MLQHNGTMTLHQSTRLSPEQQTELARQLIQINQDFNTLATSQGASSFLVRDKLQALLTQIELLLDQDIPHSSGLNLAGRIAYELELFELAKDYFVRASNLDSGNANYALNLGNALSQIELYDEAQAQFELVLKTEHTNIDAFLGIAFCHLQSGQYAHAFLHYRYALANGRTTTLLHDQLAECIEHIQCDEYNENLELLFLYLFKLEDIDTKRLLRFASELLTSKYHLNDPQCVLDIDSIVQDPLLIHILETGTAANHFVEELVTQLRTSIFVESMLREGIRDELLPCAIALGVYANHTDYALIVSDEEEAQLSLLKQRIYEAAGQSRIDMDESIGALILLSMYEALYVQRFSFNLLAYELEQWPVALQSLLKASLYDLSDEHQVKHSLFGTSMNELLENGVSRAQERWHAVPAAQRTSFYATMCRHLGPTQVPKHWAKSGARVLMLACNTGKKAYRYATQFSDIEVLAADKSETNMAYAHTQVSASGLHNLEFAVADYTNPPQEIAKFDFIEFGENFDYQYLDRWLGLLKDDGIARVSVPSLQQQEHVGVITQLIKARGMQPSLENIRVLRNSILLEKNSALWSKLLEQDQFYSSAGCKALLFNTEKQLYSANETHGLLANNGFNQLKPQGEQLLTKQVAHASANNDVFELFASKSAI